MRILGKWLTNIWVWLLIIALGSLALKTYLDRSTQDEESITLAPTLPPSSPYSLSQNATVEVEGGLVQVSANRTGTIREVLVAEGDRVKAGQILALQEDRDDRIAVRLAEIAVDNERIKQERDALEVDILQRDLERVELQRAQDAVSQQALDSQKDRLTKQKLTMSTNQNALERAQTQLETARFNLSQRQVVSPVDGRILSAAVTAGAGVSAENISAAFTIIPDRPKRLRAKVEERDVDKIFLGQSVDFAASNRSDQQLQGRVMQIGEIFSAADTGLTTRNTLDVIIEAETVPFRLGKTVLVRFRKQGGSGD